jgi:hypothetical protein
MNVYVSMHPLFPYSQNATKLTMTGELKRSSIHSLVLTISDPRGALRNGPQGDEKSLAGEALIRAHELWQDTCFECFWSEPGKTDYYEMNASAGGKWNVYHFDSYRAPQPPRETDDYRVTEVTVKEGEVHITVQSELELPPVLECGITMIANTNDGEQYYALAHKGTEPDFHVRESFVVRV